jgi:hypothetical protein
MDKPQQPQELPVDHWKSRAYDDQSILYRIADLLEELLNETRKIRKEHI